MKTMITGAFVPEFNEDDAGGHGLCEDKFSTSLMGREVDGFADALSPTNTGSRRSSILFLSINYRLEMLKNFTCF